RRRSRVRGGQSRRCGHRATRARRRVANQHLARRRRSRRRSPARLGRPGPASSARRRRRLRWRRPPPGARWDRLYARGQRHPRMVRRAIGDVGRCRRRHRRSPPRQARLVIGTPPPIDIGALAQLACLLEVNAPKPGNVSPRGDFDDTTYDDFVASSAAINTALGTAGSRPLGKTILLAIEATRAVTATNTNLGIVLLFAPLARAAAAITSGGDWTDRRIIDRQRLRRALADVLVSTTVDDARHAYAAIRLAS